MVHFTNAINRTDHRQIQTQTAVNTAPSAQNTQSSVSAGNTTPLNFCAIFSPQITGYASTAAPLTSNSGSAVSAPVPTPAAAPTAESVFGPNPWLSNPTGKNPDGSFYSYNPIYFASADTAAKVAQMVGGKVVDVNVFTPVNGPFQQQQPNHMVEMPDGRLINPGLIASFYTHGYSQSMVDAMIAREIAG